jgi:hypothetical protein
MDETVRLAMAELLHQLETQIAPKVAQDITSMCAYTAMKQVHFGEFLGRGITEMRENLEGIHEGIAREAQQAMVESYQLRLASSRWPQGYRSGASDNVQGRYANGVLLNALRSPQMFRASESGIGFINPTFLDKRAMQWKRLNYGTGGSDGSPAYSATFQGLTIAGLGLPGQPSAPFRLPAGLWEGGRFFPFSEKGGGFTSTGPTGHASPFKLQHPARTKPVEPWDFLQDGVAVIVERLPVAYVSQFTRAQIRAVERMQGI